ncbi:MAG: DUF2268 domain-containing putative Zn-dependent protease [bacterium]
MGARRGVAFALLALSVAATSPRQGTVERPHDAVPVVSTADVHRFVAALHRIPPGDRTCAAFGDYLAAGSPGLIAYSAKFGVGRKELCNALRRSPALYAPLEGQLAGVDSARTAIADVYATYRQRIDPDGKLPPVYFVVGNGISGGTTVGWRDPIVLIGVERAGRIDRIAPTIAHEFVHTQQHYPWLGALTGGPSFLRGSLLRHSIKEGSANLGAELLTGTRQGNAYGEAHATALWTEFQAAMHGTDYSRWLYNGWNVKVLGDRPPDLGYWMGYQVAKAYYEKAADKRQAVRDILSISDFDGFVQASGYNGVALTRLSVL